MGFRIEIPGGGEIKGDTPDETLKTAVKQAEVIAQTAAQALASGDLESYKKLAGQLVLTNNLATVGAKAAVEQVFPKIPADKFEQIVGAGVLTYLGTGDLTLTVLSVAQEYLAIYPSLDEDGDQPAIMADGAIVRPHKTYSTRSAKIWQYLNKDGKVDIWAGFNRDPVLTDASGKETVWPAVDLVAGDIVEMVAELDPIEQHTVKSVKGIYTGTSKNTPGLATNQVTLLVKFTPSE